MDISNRVVVVKSDVEKRIANNEQVKDICASLGISRTTLWRLRKDMIREAIPNHPNGVRRVDKDIIPAWRILKFDYYKFIEEKSVYVAKEWRNYLNSFEIQDAILDWLYSRSEEFVTKRLKYASVKEQEDILYAEMHKRVQEKFKREIKIYPVNMINT